MWAETMLKPGEECSLCFTVLFVNGKSGSALWEGVDGSSTRHLTLSSPPSLCMVALIQTPVPQATGYSERKGCLAGVQSGAAGNGRPSQGLQGSHVRYQGPWAFYEIKTKELGQSLTARNQ